ncbi:glycerol kinase GlpK [Chondromyces apiculatus]|uniref:glycerol kinase n=1 Tax=Chondromyces apiculatus DSM 436 TaxID=1192034 RepID=A0A017STZ4_9BACT|nr:glycerol kinase GlpK [Chondromyces apiculatus]EYF00035.1 Glycerol kinase [Chondromyces apiculatus DSM 436]
MDADLLLAIDQGTTGTTALIMEASGATRGRATREFRQHFPAPGLVEHDPDEIWESVGDAVREALATAGVRGERIRAIGITNQRETTVVWERRSGRPIHRAIVWQDRRTADRCAALRAAGHEPTVKATTGLVLDPYFSGTKLAWILDHVGGARARAEAGDLAFGTIDSFLVWRLSGDAQSGGEAVHATDVTNASRTLLMSLETLDWDERMLRMLGVPRAMLPRIVGSAERVAVTRNVPHLPDGIPIAGIAGDQQAALFGQACFGVGEAKCTYGTGAFALVNVGGKPLHSRFGLLTSVGWRIGDEVVFVLEGSAFIAGAAVQWLRDGLGVIERASDIEALARQVPSSDGVMFVPAMSGLGAPYWDPEARGLICGMTRGTTKAHLARATLEGIAHEVADLLGAMAEDLGQPLLRMRVDGGAAANDLLMQFQADAANITIDRPTELESTARGAAMLAGVGVGMFQNKSDAAQMAKLQRTFWVEMDEAERAAHRQRWAEAVSRSRSSVPRG